MADVSIDNDELFSEITQQLSKDIESSVEISPNEVPQKPDDYTDRWHITLMKSGNRSRISGIEEDYLRDKMTKIIDATRFIGRHSPIKINVPTDEQNVTYIAAVQFSFVGYYASCFQIAKFINLVMHLMISDFNCVNFSIECFISVGRNREYKNMVYSTTSWVHLDNIDINIIELTLKNYHIDFKEPHGVLTPSYNAKIYSLARLLMRRHGNPCDASLDWSARGFHHEKLINDIQDNVLRARAQSLNWQWKKLNKEVDIVEVMRDYRSIIYSSVYTQTYITTYEGNDESEQMDFVRAAIIDGRLKRNLTWIRQCTVDDDTVNVFHLGRLWVPDGTPGFFPSADFHMDIAVILVSEDYA